MSGRDLLDSLLSTAKEHQIVVPNGQTRNGWHVYASADGGSWVADKDRRSEGAPQDGHALHLRTAGRAGEPGAMPKWHRSYFRTHFARPTVYCSFRIDKYDAGHHHGGGIGFKLTYLHQDNLTGYHVMLHVDGRAQIYKEARDGVDGRGVPGTSLVSTRWRYMPGVRRHLIVAQEEDGTIVVFLDGELLMKAKDEHAFQSGQIGLRLDGLDARVHSLVVRAPEEWDVHPDVSEWAMASWQWGLDESLINGLEADHPSTPQTEVSKQELMAILHRYSK